jgi:predicted small lipoprotein YifL
MVGARRSTAWDGRVRSTRRLTIAAILVAVVLAGCGTEGGKEADPASKDATSTSEASTTERTTTTEEPTTTEKPTTTKPPAPDGSSKAKPLPVGTEAKISDEWKVTVTDIKPNATAEVQGGNEFNDPPKKGQFMLVTLDATYTGTDEGMPDTSLVVALSGGDNVQYKNFECNAAFGAMEFPTLEPGGKATVQECLDVPPAAIKGGAVFVEDQLKFDGDARRYWAIPGA